MEWKWTPMKEAAAERIAQSKSDTPLTDVARALRMSHKNLYKWMRNPEFRKKVAELKREIAEAVKRAGIRLKENRVEFLNDDFNRTQQVIDARAEAHAHVPGGASGLLVRRVRHFGEEYVVDAALMRERREISKHAAIELGEWVEKQQIDTSENKPLPIDITLTIDKVYGEKEPAKEEEPAKADGSSETANTN
jgi:hypothetical protein